MERPIIHHYSTTLGGGAGLACIRGIKHLEDLNEFQQKIFTLDARKQKSQSIPIQIIPKGPLAKLKIFLNKVLGRIFVIRNKRSEVFDIGDGFYSKTEESDITHIHWITQFLKIKSFIKPHKKYVWSLHDLAPLTGGCHYFWDCTGYQHDCSNCPQTKYNFIHQRPKSNLTSKLRIFHEKKAHLKIIATSEYSFQAAQRSTLVRNSEYIDVVKIPYGIDTEVFFPKDKKESRREIGIDSNLFTICFGAENLKSHRKGGDLFYKILKQLGELELEIQIVTFGDGDFSRLQLPFHIHSMGTTFDEDEVSSIYSSANLFLALSRQEAFGQTAQEALACSTPVICYENTGFADQVIHRRNGFILPMASVEGVVEAIQKLYGSQQMQKEFQEHARMHIKTNFAKELIAKRYAELYRELLK